jgi:drug/metabolite transporter (DMT)-like permease
VSRAVVLAYAACALIWGTTWYAIRVCLSGYPTLTVLALRFVIAAAVIVPIAATVRPWPRGRAWGYLVLAGLLDAGAYLLVYLGEERVSGGVGAVVYGTQPLILALLLAGTRIEALTRKHVIGAIVSLVGVGVLFLDRLDVSARQAVGVVLVFGSVIVATVYSAIMKRHGGGVPNLVATAIFLAVTAAALGVIALVAGQGVPWPPPVAPTVALLYLGIIGSVVAFLFYFWLLDQTSLQLTSTLVFVYPLIALVTDALFEHAIELGPRAYAGAGITLGGLAVSLRRR